MKQNLHQGLRTWIEIDRAAIKQNYEQFRKIIPKTCKLCAVVKSNAYGHGLVGFSKEVAELGADFLAVDSVVEGLRLREEGIKTPILVLGYTLPELIEKAVENNLSLSVSHFEALKSLLVLSAGRRIKVHIKVDTGMHRQGFFEQDIPLVIKFLKQNSDKIEVEGLFTHFAAAKDPATPAETQEQIALFKKWVDAFRGGGFKPIIHASATAGAILFPEAHFDMVRIGIGMYGIWPSDEIKNHIEKKLPLKPILSWNTIISEIKELPKGARIGYDFTEKLTRNSKIAVCPIGYWHGFPRALSGIGGVLVDGVKAKVLGRVSMDMISIDVTDVINPQIGDEVVIIGQSGKEKISSESVAALINGSQYEFVTTINPLIQKIHL